MNQGSAGRWILTSIAALTAVSGFLADWNRTQEGRGGARAARGPRAEGSRPDRGAPPALA
jgi:hypothetical protein